MQTHKLNTGLTILIAAILLPLLFFAGLVALVIFAVFFTIIGVSFFLRGHLKSKSSPMQKIENFHGNTYDHHD